MVDIVFDVNKLAIAYVMQLRGIRNFGISKERWKRLFGENTDEENKSFIKEIQTTLDKEYLEAEKLHKIVEKEWKQQEKNVLVWLKELTKVGIFMKIRAPPQSSKRGS